MRGELELDYDGKPFTVSFSYLPGRPAKTYGPPENCRPSEPAEMDWELEWFKSEEAIVRLAYPEKAMLKFISRPYSEWVKAEAETLCEKIVRAIERHCEIADYMGEVA